jgi:DNA-binding MarR family transcriptional regulator
MSTPSLSADDYRSLAEIRYQIRCFLRFSERAARAAGLEPQQHQLLLACKGLPKASRPTIGTLAERLCVQHHTAVALVDNLAALGLVERVRNSADRREVLVEITARGEASLRRLSALHHEQLRNVAPVLIQALGAIDAGSDSEVNSAQAPGFERAAIDSTAPRGAGDTRPSRARRSIGKAAKRSRRAG